VRCAASYSVLNGQCIARRLRQETAQIEVTDELYPGTLAFLELLNALLKHSNQAKLYESLGLGLRVPGLQPYLDYVTEVLVSAEARGYRARYQKSKIMRLSLQFIETLLTQFALEDADFADRLVDVCVVYSKRCTMVDTASVQCGYLL
jgi:hypothetical protein